jgi:hypothetical protein
MANQHGYKRRTGAATRGAVFSKTANAKGWWAGLEAVEKDTKLAQKLGQRQPFGQLGHFQLKGSCLTTGMIVWANLWT